MVRHGFHERHELVAGLARRRDGLAGRRGDLTEPRQVAGEEEAAAGGGRCTPETSVKIVHSANIF